MSSALKFRECDFPSDWSDDIRMNFLFATFRERLANPEGYDGKMRFWMNTVQDLCLRTEIPVISLESLTPALTRKGREPMCLDVVLENMEKQGLIESICEFNRIEPERGWLSWSVDILVQKPVSWGISTVQSFLNFSKKDERYVVVSVIKEIAHKILCRYQELIESKWTDSAIFLDHLRNESVDICSDFNFSLAIVQLQKDREATVFEDNGEKIIKFKKPGENKVEPLSELDKGVLNLKRVRMTLDHDIEVIETNITSYHNTIKQCLKEKNQTKAKFVLMKKKRLEILLKQKSAALDNVENLLSQLKSKGSEKMVLEAYRIGAQAMKKALGADMELDSIDEVMSDVKEVLDDFSEVQRTISSPVSPGDESLEEFEDELNDLLAEEDNGKVVPNHKESPARGTDDDLMKRLMALRAPPEDSPPMKKPTLRIARHAK